MSAREGRQPLISQWVRQPLGTRSSLAVNSNGINIKKKTGVVAAKINKALVSNIVQNENIDISAVCNVVKVSSQGIQVPTVETASTSNSTDTTSYSSQALEEVTDVDAQDSLQSLLVSEYVQDIYRHMWYLETQHSVPENFLQGQKVSAWMRATVIDWLIQLQMGFTLLTETLYLTVAIMYLGDGIWPHKGSFSAFA